MRETLPIKEKKKEKKEEEGSREAEGAPGGVSESVCALPHF